ncbi:MAG: hypothetical protein AUK34_09600 [Ignavibacteria bacterium CG2_30_36_16]|nr:MAG: hypothetical protein AUK34_09600 [Ignavibacteria bacterium CG2_30_36_16]
MIMYNGFLIKTNGYSGALLFPLPTTLIMPLSISPCFSIANNNKAFVINDEPKYAIMLLIVKNVFPKEAMK